MNKQMKQNLETVLDAIVENNTAAAKAAFHEYLRAKTHSILLGEAEEKCEECGMMKCECDEEDEKDDKKKDKKEKKVDDAIEKVEKDVKKTKKAQAEDEKDD